MTIYREVTDTDHNPESRTWYYDNLGNRVDKNTGKYVILVTKKIDEPKQLLNESSEYYDTKPCDTE